MTKLVVMLALQLACDRGDAPGAALELATTPAAGAIDRHAFTAKQVALQRSKYGATLLFLDELVKDPCSIDTLYAERRFAFMIGLGVAQPPVAHLDITQLGRDDSLPDNMLGRRYANYYRPSRDADGIQSLGYGGGSYHLVLDTFDPHGTATGRIAIGRFKFDEARLSGTFTAQVCPE